MSGFNIEHVDIPADTFITRWALDNVPRIVKAYSQKGGWEGWAQVEIATALQDKYSNADKWALNATDAVLAATTTVAREVPVYTPTLTKTGRLSQQRTDVVVAFGPDAAREFVIIELKCEGLYNKGDFLDAVRADHVKIHGGIENQFKPARVWAMAFSVSEDIYRDVLAWKHDADHRIIWPTPSSNMQGLSPREQQAMAGMKIVLWIFEQEILR